MLVLPFMHTPLSAWISLGGFAVVPAMFPLTPKGRESVEFTLKVKAHIVSVARLGVF
jgi:hypothetical protein